MATLAISKTISAPDMTRAVAALRAHFGMSASASPAQVQAEWEKMVLAQLKSLVQQFEHQAAQPAPPAQITLT